MHIDRRLAGPHQPPNAALLLFHSARATMNRAFVALLKTSPDAADIALEIDGTAAVLRQLAALIGGAP